MKRPKETDIHPIINLSNFLQSLILCPASNGPDTYRGARIRSSRRALRYDAVVLPAGRVWVPIGAMSRPHYGYLALLGDTYGGLRLPRRALRPPRGAYDYLS